MNIHQQLSAPFPIQSLHWVKKGKAAPELAHLNARDVMKRLDDVVGMQNWQDKITFQGNTAICQLSIKIDGEWITKSDASGETNIEAEKGGASTAFKRAAAKFGIGRYLYYLPQGVNSQNIHQVAWATPQGYVDAINKKEGLDHES